VIRAVLGKTVEGVRICQTRNVKPPSNPSPVTGSKSRSSSIVSDRIGLFVYVSIPLVMAISEVSRPVLLRLLEDLFLAQQLPCQLLTTEDCSRLPSLCAGSVDLVYVWAKSAVPYKGYIGGREGSIRAIGWAEEVGIGVGEMGERLLKVLDLNANSPLGCWKVLATGGKWHPALEWFLYTKSPLQSLIWQFVLSLNTQFQQEVPLFLPHWRQVATKVKEILLSQGFRNIKEAQNPRGISYLVILQDEDLPASWNKFPLKVEITEKVTFRLYFSMESAVITAQKAFISACKQLISILNWELEVGFYTYTSLSNQLNFLLQLPYSCISLSDIDAVLLSCYNSCISSYRSTAKALVCLYRNSKNANESVEDVCEYMTEVEIGGNHWVKLDYGTERTAFERDCKGLETLKNMQIAGKYCFAQPIAMPIPRLCSILVKHSPLLVPLPHFLQHFPCFRPQVLAKLQDLIENFRRELVLPSLEMLHCTREHGDIFIVPEKGFLGSAEVLGRQVVSLFGELWTQRYREIGDFEGFFEVKFDDFEGISPVFIGFHETYQAKIGEKEILLHKINEFGITPDLEELIELHRSLNGVKTDLENPIIGWSRGKAGDFEENCWFICEDYSAKAWNCDLTWTDIAAIIDILLDMHAKGLFHWFLSPFTLRRSALSHQITLTFPSLQSCLSPLISLFLPSVFRPFLAPEVQRFLQESVAVDSGAQADVYSVCRLLRESKEREIMHISLVAWEVLETGLCADPGKRPSMQDLAALVQTALGQFSS